MKFDRPATRRAYRSDLADFFGSNDITLDMALAVSFVQVNQYIAGLEASGAKASTIRRRVAALRGFFDWLEALGAIEKNPAHRQLIRKIKSVRNKDRVLVVLTAEQANQLMHAAKESSMRNHAMMATMLHCVLRRSEVASMDVDHIRLIGKYWILDLPSTKGGADQYVKVPEHVVELIEEHKEHYGIGTGPLWRSHSRRNPGGRLTPTSIYRIVRETALKAGLPEIGAHTLRHTGCTLAIDNGASLQQVQTHARHKQIETTMVYVHQRDRLRDSAADFIKIDESSET
ncbi:MAG: tyrosine-type recombinase/integrase [Rhodothermales bacterium]